MNSAPHIRTLLVLGRVSNLPTVWSNCLAGWWLGGGGHYWKLPFLLLGVSLLYTGGAFLNDAFDEEFDRQRRAERPIPTGRISASRVWRLGFGQLALGIVLLFFCGKVAAVAAVLLALSILLDLPLPRMSMFEIDYASVSEIELKPNRVEIQLLNFTPWRHLQP